MRHFWWLLGPAILCLAVPAQARARDDALSGAFRCAVIADSRAWLDCYYGAAQPQRAALGLSPALGPQIKLAASPPAGGPLRDQPVRDEVMSAAAGCIRVAEDRPWLDCYYAAAVPMRVQLGLSAPKSAPRPQAPPAPLLASSAPAAPQAAAPQAAAPSGPPPMPRNTGLLRGLFSNLKPIVRGMPMQSYTLDRQGAFTVTLVDGQVWQQSPEDEIYHPARWRKDASQMLVTVSPDVMHTFTLAVAGEDRIYKVHRIH